MSLVTVGLALVCAGLGAAAGVLLGPAGAPRSVSGVIRLPATVAVPAISSQFDEPAADSATATTMWLRAKQADVLSPPPVEAGFDRRDSDRAEGVDNTGGQLHDSSDVARNHW